MQTHRQTGRTRSLAAALLGFAGVVMACTSEGLTSDPPGLALMRIPLAEEPSATVVFTFDVVSRGVYERTLPIFAERGFPAVVYAETGPLDSGESWVMSWAQLRDLQDRHGWEVGSHTVNHPDLTTVPDRVLDQELRDSRERLISERLAATAFATPYGAYDLRVLAAAATYYASHRAASGGPAIWPLQRNDYEIRCAEITNTTSVAQVERWIDDAIARAQTIVFLMHEIVPGVPQPYEYNEQDLRAIVAYLASRPIRVTTMAGALAYARGANLVENHSFSDARGGWAVGWRRSDPAFVALDEGGHGDVSGAARSAKLVGGARQRELSRQVVLNGASDYVVRMYQNVQDLRVGGVAVWIDELDSGGGWRSGRWLGGTYANFVGVRHYRYRPTSTSISSVVLTIYTEQNSELTVFVDGVELRPAL